MTLVEVLIAVAILLIGVYTVAAVFPLLQRQIHRQGKIGQAVGMTDASLSEWLADTESIPAGIFESPSFVTGPVNYRTGEVSSVSDDQFTGYEFMPQDPMEAIPGATTDPVRNALRDLRDVVGERVTIKAPAAPLPGLPTLWPYLLRMGPAEPATIMVWERLEYTSGALGALLPGQFAVNPATGVIDTSPLPGTVDTITGNGFIVANYDWVDPMGAAGPPNVTYGLQDEVIAVSTIGGIASGSTTPLTAGYGGSVVPGTMRVWGLRPFVRDAIADGGNGNGAIDPGEYDLSPAPPAVDPFGAVIYFNTLDAGRTVDVSYRVRDWSILSEERTVPFYEPHVVRLSVVPLWTPDPANPIPEKDDLFGGVGGVGELVAAFDMTDGVYLHDKGGGLVAGDALYERGQVGFTAPIPAGHKLRLYYRAADNRAVQFICAARSYVPLGGGVSTLLSHMVPPGGVEPMDLDEARGYVLERVSNVPGLVGPALSGNAWVLLFTPSEAGKTVTIAYAYSIGGGPIQRARAFADISTGGLTYSGATWHYVVLGPAQPASPLALWAISSVSGASVKVRTWWTDDKGRYQRADADGFLAPSGV